MDPVASVVDGIKGLAKSGEDFVRGLLHRPSRAHHDNPIEILKRLQREAFSDLMKLRDRQEKVERMLSFYRSSKGSPFQSASTHLKGAIDFVGALLFVENDDQMACNTLNKAGIKPGIYSRFMLEAMVGEKDIIVAELKASAENLAYQDDVPRSPLTLSKLMYQANAIDGLSVMFVPLGAQCNDFGIASNLEQIHRYAGCSSSEPPLFTQYHDCAAGVIIRGSRVVASLAELMKQRQVGVSENSTSSSTFGQVVYQTSDELKLTLSGVWQVPRSPRLMGLNTSALPMRLRRRTSSDGLGDASAAETTNRAENISAGSIALMLESEIDLCTKVRGWVELQRSSPRMLQWAISLSDAPEDELGWGMILSGKFEPNVREFQLEGFLRFNLGKRSCAQTGFVYMMNGRSHCPALVLRSNWSI